jgi:GTP cyclohydrolase I
LNHAHAGIRIACDSGKITVIETSLQVGIATLCPCSKEISEYSAHNQRGFVTMKVQWETADAWATDWKSILLDAAESNASSALHPVLKRPDEKVVTERAYENPRFVEDMARLVSAELYEQSGIKAFTVECRNEESIHLHDAIARITYDKSMEEAAW